MKKIYKPPSLEIELYQLDASIAGSCGTKVSMGPEYGAHQACDEFNFDVMTLGLDTSFYEEGIVCNCYYTAGGEGYFTS